MEGKLALLLFAEDEPLILLSSQEALEEAGYTVHGVASGTEAINWLENQKERPSGLITDIRLGSGPSGWVVARRARELYPHIPVVYTSGDSAAEHTVHGVPESVSVQKPYASAQIVTAISVLLNAVPPPPA